ncbi:uncharacterized protein H6S33_012288 [Morchella sextelata]|uniref:uncharacterized protein n=1 Tax=Morchella sextelata TaxID=1174677 RepID=UPI001D04EA6E|nr:uncharacterized protein H6S33_012288 [Morchella sextelata]KAH0609742.1 hypothetical protein H6S33_012288 [Morchella sextelata]
MRPALYALRATACRRSTGHGTLRFLPQRPLAPSRRSTRSSSSLRPSKPLHEAAPHHDSPSTIFALSTAAGKSAIAVVRISGPACMDIFASLCPSTLPPKPRRATLRTLYKPHTNEILDPGSIVLYFPGPRSVTGEDTLELHLHGGPAIVRAVLGAIPQARSRHRIVYAEPGEFTRRAFANERLTLPQIEALGDILSAATEQQRIQSVRSSTSALSQRYEGWRAALIAARGELEALIDFSEDQQFETSSSELLRNVVVAVERLRSVLKGHVANAMKGEMLRSGISLALVGAPNAGKSSLLNRVVGREAVIVSGEAGTTRDVVDLSVDLGGFMVVLGDTAGLRVGDVAEGVGEIEKEGIKRAKKRVMEGDLVVVVLSVEETADGPQIKISPEVCDVVREAAGKEIIVVVNKMDLLPGATLPHEALDKIATSIPGLPPGRVFGISCTAEAGAGIQEFLNGLIAIFKEMTSPISSSLASSDDWHESIGATERQRLLVEECIESLDSFLAHTSAELEEETDVVVAAEELRMAAEALAKITGRGEGAGDVEEVLGVVFEKFCVGK